MPASGVKTANRRRCLSKLLVSDDMDVNLNPTLLATISNIVRCQSCYGTTAPDFVVSLRRPEKHYQ